MNGENDTIDANTWEFYVSIVITEEDNVIF